MKRLILLLLLTALPFQMSWAVVTGYCQHEEGKAAQHLGHHEHKHQASGESKLSKGKYSNSSFGFNDTDCGCHHLCCVTFVSSEHHQPGFPPNSTAVEFQLNPYLSHIPDGLTKPDWLHTI